MPSEPLVLAFDTSAAHCAAALLSGDRIIAVETLEMSRGQAEQLFPLLERVLQQANTTWADLNRIGVGIGPGNFTGIRISVAAARGLGVSLGIPVIGISSLEAQFTSYPIAATVPAPRDQVYFQPFLPEPGDAELITSQDAKRKAAELGLDQSYVPLANDLVVAIARLALKRAPDHAPAPLYVRAADAAPPKDPAPVILP